MTMDRSAVDTTVPPSGTGCAECDAADPPGWWVHLRRCAACGHVGCCDSSPRQHATAHANATGHRYIQSFEPGEEWFYDYATGDMLDGPALAGPTSRPGGQPVPGPAGRVPQDWRSQVH
jgi:Zn ribbon nucleic-acid-binding protein